MASNRQQHPDLWLEDGNLILCSEGTMFRVHRSMLTRNSPFFQSRLANTDLELYEGQPVLELQPGIASTSDLEALLYHLYHDKPLLWDTPFEQVSRILRASTQYELFKVKEQAISRLMRVYQRRPAPYECSHWPHVQEAAQLALNCQVQELLPSLLYGVILTSDFHVEEEDLTSITGITTPHVDNDAVETNYLHTVCGRLIKQIMRHFAPVLFTVATGDHMECTELLADHWMNLAIQPALEDSGVYKPLETLKRIQNIDWASLGLCGECCEAKRAEWDEEADTFWAKLQDWTKLDSDIYSSRNSTIQ